MCCCRQGTQLLIRGDRFEFEAAGAALYQVLSANHEGKGDCDTTMLAISQLAEVGNAGSKGQAAGASHDDRD